MTDADWLRQAKPGVSDAQAEEFCERVAIRVADDMDEFEARILTFSEMEL